MTTREQWLALAERCEKATGPDDAVDWDMLMAMCGPGYEDSWLAAPAARYALSTSYGYHAPEWTASLDAITALIERELPGWGWSIRRKPRDKVCTAHIGTSVTVSVRIQQKPAIALCAAFCRAMAEKA